MDISWLEILLYGIVSGLTEFLPVSAQAHQTILLNIFGLEISHPLMDLFVHGGMLLAVFVSSGSMIRRVYLEYKVSKLHRRRRKRAPNSQAVLDMRFVKMAVIPLLLSFLFYQKTGQWSSKLPILIGTLVANGIILYFPMHLSRANKDSRNMSSLDGVLFGIGSALSVIPGISRIGAGTSIAVARGAEPQHTFRWSILLSIPALAGILFFDVLHLFSVGFNGTNGAFVMKCAIAGICAFCGGYLSISLIKSFLKRNDFTSFSYYCWGAALFAFILYLY